MQVDTQHRRTLLVPHVAQEDAPDHVAVLVLDRERQLALALRNVLEPAPALIRRHAARTGADEQFLGIVGARWPLIVLLAAQLPYAVARCGSGWMSVGDGHLSVLYARSFFASKRPS